MPRRFNKTLVFVGVLVALGLVYALGYHQSEPFYNNDETRHVMTGVYFRDVLHDAPVSNLRGYTINYYLQYPALGLLVWPPFFYFIEGLLMSIFGTSLIVSKALVVLFAALACCYLFRLVCRTHDDSTATVAVLIFALAPLVFNLSHYVMLDVPTLALGLAATYHFILYLEEQRRRHLLLAALAAALSALTRFDAVYLIPLFLLLLISGRRLRLLWRKEVLIVAALALVIVAPFYAISASGIGWMHFKFATETLNPNDPAFLSLKRFFFYPSLLPTQISWVALVPAAIGLAFGLTKAGRAASAPYLAIIAATYLTFTPLGELESRHTIYWLPAFALCAATGLRVVAHQLRAPRLHLPLAALVLIGMAWTVLAKPRLYLRGYEEAARYVAANGQTSPYCFFLGRLNGNFVYQLRRHDPARKLWVLRADKLLYSVVAMPDAEHRQFAANDEEALGVIYKFDPEFLVVEQPPPPRHLTPDEQLRLSFEEQVRAVLINHPERFKLEREIAVDSNDPDYAGMRLLVFRNIFRNEKPERNLSLEILMLRDSLQTTVP